MITGLWSLAFGQRCHGLAPWSITLAATKGPALLFKDATALCRGVSRLLLPSATESSTNETKAKSRLL